MHKRFTFRVKYESPTCNVKVMETAVGIWGYTWPYQPYIGQYGGPNFNNIGIGFNWTNSIDSKTFRNWAAATANNSVFEFQNYASANGLPNPPGNLKILITPWGDGNTGATPMLEKLGITGEAWSQTTTSIWGGVFGIFSAVPLYMLAFPFGAAITIAAPDVVLNINNGANIDADDFRNILYHELAHTQHAMQAGPTYWSNNIGYIAEHLGYGQASFLGSGSCAIIEMWGFQNGLWATHLRYGLNHSNGGFNPAFNTWEARLESGVFVDGFIPFGWQHDIQDNNSTNPTGVIEVSGLPDGFSGITKAQIFSTMTSSMFSPTQQKNALIPLIPPTVPIGPYNTLANYYGL